MTAGIQEVSGHHKYGPSALDSLALCVRFKYYSKPGDTSGSEGTELHDAFETGELAGLNDEQEASVATCRYYVESLKYDGNTTPEDWEDHAEIKLFLKGLTHGRADRVLFCKKLRLLHVIDAKFTRVETDHEMQLRTYGAAFVEMHPGEVDTVETHVVAPRLQDLERHSYAATMLLDNVREYITELYAKIEDPFTPPTAHPDLCGKCARAAKCPALSDTMALLCRGTGLPVPSSFNPGAMTSVRDRLISMLLAPAAIAWGDLVKKGNAEYVQQGGEIPGFKIMTRSSGARIEKQNTAEAIERIAAFPGMTQEAVLGCCKMTVGDVAKAVAFSVGTTEAVAKARVKETLDDLIVETSSSFLTKVKRIDDIELLKQVQ